MRLALASFCLVVICETMATAQTQSEEKKPGDPPYSTGRAVLPDNKGQLQPQGWTGPLSTGTGGAPATSPQGAHRRTCNPLPAVRPRALLIPRLLDGKATPLTIFI